ncbi:PorV/PorQ family protein [candidate division KSB1 bacterium]|nr:PorV/PorQ family protein [candidate division KSB1 bacterium]
MKKCLATLLLTLCAVAPTLGQGFAPVGTAVAQFLEIGLGARATGMGSAYTAMVDDAGAVFWNPAGLVHVENHNLFTAYNQWPADISLVGASYAVTLGNIGTFALHSVYLMTDDMEITTIQKPDGTGSFFSIANYSMGISFARMLTDRVSVGLTGKVVHEKYWENGYTTFAVDLGTLYKTGFHGLQLGMSILHFGPDVTYNGDYIDYSDSRSFDANRPKSFEPHSMPINFRFGISIDVIDRGNSKLTTAVDMIHPNNNLEQYNLGAEYGFNRTFFLRGGYQFESDEGGLCFGTGIRSSLIGQALAAIDYSYADLGVLQDVHRVSFSLSY